jgi:hypothetical protein
MCADLLLCLGAAAAGIKVVNVVYTWQANKLAKAK